MTDDKAEAPKMARVTHEVAVTRWHSQVTGPYDWGACDGGDADLGPGSSANGRRGLLLPAQVLQRAHQLPSSQRVLITAWEGRLSCVHGGTAKEDRHGAAKARGLEVHSRIKHGVPTQRQAGREPVPFSVLLGPFFVHDSCRQRSHPPARANRLSTCFPD